MFYTLNILTVIVSLVGLVGNAIVLFLLGFCMHRNTFSVYILNLAGADFLFLCFETLYSLEKHFDVHGIYIDIPNSLNILLNFAYLAGLSMLTAISAERCLSVVCPIWYRCRRPRHTSTVMCTLLWTLSLLLSLLEGKACGWLYSFDYGWCMKLDFITFAWLIVLIVVLLGSTLTLIFRIFCDSRRIPVTRLYVTIAFTVLVFLLFGLSYGIYWFFLFWTGVVFICNVFEMSSFLSCVNSCANPIIYFLVGSIRHHRLQQQTLKMRLQRAIQDTPEEEVGKFQRELSTKWVLNIVSTGAHVLLGKTLQNHMLDLRIANSKFFCRALTMLQRFSGQCKARCIKSLLQAIHFPQPLSDDIWTAPISYHVQVAHEKEKWGDLISVLRAVPAACFCCWDGSHRQQPVSSAVAPVPAGPSRSPLAVIGVLRLRPAARSSGRIPLPGLPTSSFEYNLTEVQALVEQVREKTTNIQALVHGTVGQSLPVSPLKRLFPSISSITWPLLFFEYEGSYVQVGGDEKAMPAGEEPSPSKIPQS
ncbi:Mas-related G-protein coupled receptor member X2 [Microtus ochrogaster]|uniref:Mas-related G-protein coupled receptor member X2 n=1 Tax=Microtus ochrogaster TaxID=79684 RepID=A0A8J6GUM6_MICOH|nr:Mas-related G-protein coupled receptor member X2 [Microtus ochrogaster]